jgi:hypothetical protein
MNTTDFFFKVDICAVDGALGFLVDMLSYKAPSKTLAIVENAGGILRNISSHIAVREDYRYVFTRQHGERRATESIVLIQKGSRYMCVGMLKNNAS